MENGSGTSPTAVGLKEGFLLAAQASYQAYLDYGPRSNRKLKHLHGWLRDEIARNLGRDYAVSGLGVDSNSEQIVSGMYYDKSVDLLVSRDDIDLGVVSVKFVMSNYRQNKNNYFEQQLGETANLRRSDIVFGHILVLPVPTPYYKRDGSIKKTESVTNDVIQRYGNLVEDHLYPHAPDVQALCLLKLDLESLRIVRFCGQEDLPGISPDCYQLLRGKLSLSNFIGIYGQEIRLKYAKLQKTEYEP